MLFRAKPSNLLKRKFYFMEEKEDFSRFGRGKNNALSKFLFAVACVVIAVAINTATQKIAAHFAFPLFMDSVATIAVASLCGMIPSVLCAVASNLVLELTSHNAISFMVCHICTAVFASLIFFLQKDENSEVKNVFMGGGIVKFKARRVLFGAGAGNAADAVSIPIHLFMWAGFASAISNAALGCTISIFNFFGNCDIPQIDNAVQGIFLATDNMPFAIYWGGFLSNLVDKIFSAFVSFLLYKFVRKILKIGNGQNKKENLSYLGYFIEGVFIFVAVVNVFMSAVFFFRTEEKFNKIKCDIIFAMNGNSEIEFKSEMSALSFYNKSYEENFSNPSALLEILRQDERRVNFGFFCMNYASFLLFFITMLLLRSEFQMEKGALALKFARKDEQLRISRDLHDSALQNLCAVNIFLEKGDVEKAKGIVKQTMKDLRYLCGTLKEDYSRDLESLLEEKLAFFKSVYGIDATLLCASDIHKTFSSETKKNLCLALNEILNNVAHHANAEKVVVRMTESAASFAIRVADNGIRFDADGIAQGGFGLGNIRQRIAACGGSVEWLRSESGGCEVKIRIVK